MIWFTMYRHLLGAVWRSWNERSVIRSWAVTRYSGSLTRVLLGVSFVQFTVCDIELGYMLGNIATA